jgi:AcrR family transcriptional regulator
MKTGTGTRAYVQRERARSAEANTRRILEAALDLFAERPFDQITLADVAQRAGVGVQTVVRRVGTKDGLVRAVNAWIHPQIGSARGDPLSADPAAVAAALMRQYERWGALIDRTLRQEDVSPALAEGAEAGRRAHREWVEAAFAGVLAPLPAPERRRLRAQLVAVCGVELWHVLRRDQRLSAAAARDAVAGLIAACLAHHRDQPEP